MLDLWWMITIWEQQSSICRKRAEEADAKLAPADGETQPDPEVQD